MIRTGEVAARAHRLPVTGVERMIRVLLADDHALVRAGCHSLLDAQDL